MGDPTRSTVRFSEINLRRAHFEVVDQIVYAIRSGLIRPGGQLPTVEAMAAQANVSKPVIGEAIRMLREHGVVETKRGVQGGVSIVTDDIPSALLRITSGWREATLTELVEARRTIDEELTLLAAARAEPSDYAEMRETLGRMKLAFHEENNAGFLRYDHMFHYQIGRAARSDLLAFYQHRVLSDSAAALLDYNLFNDVPDLVISAHEFILEAMLNRDREQIRDAVDRHWRTSSNVLATIEEMTTLDSERTVADRS